MNCYFCLKQRCEGVTRTAVSEVKVATDSGTEHKFEGLDAFFEWCTNERITYAFCWDFGYWGMFFDYWALSRGLPEFNPEETKRGGNGRSVGEECFSAFYAANGIMGFKLTLKRTKSTHRQYLDKSKDSYHTTSFRGLRPYYGNLKYEAVIEGLYHKIIEESPFVLRMLWENCVKVYKRICDIDLSDRNKCRNIYTAGKCAQEVYLKMRYGKNSLKSYQKEHSTSKSLENYFRERNLLLGGMCVSNPQTEGRLLKRIVYRPIRKYDRNGLYSFISDKAGELFYDGETTVRECFEKPKEGAVYILTVRKVFMRHKKGVPYPFFDPHSKAGRNSNVEMAHEWCVFKELWEALQNYYDIEEGEIVKITRYRKSQDPFMITYNKYFANLKVEGKESGDTALYYIAKIFKNGLLGKFSQKTIYREQAAYYDDQIDMVRFDSGKLVDRWDRKHFDYVRGAYIYTMARVAMMNDIYRYFSAGGKNRFNHYFYTDTDSIVTDIDLPAADISDTEEGKYKIEDEYVCFGVLAPKEYYGYTVNAEHSLTCAGIPRADVVKAVTKAYPKGISAEEFFRYFSGNLTIEIATRVSGGAMKVSKEIKITPISNLI